MKNDFKIRILNALIRYGIEYDTATYLVSYKEREALRLLNTLKKSNK